MLLGGFFNGAKALQAQKLIYIKDVIEYIISVDMWFAVNNNNKFILMLTQQEEEQHQLLKTQ